MMLILEVALVLSFLDAVVGIFYYVGLVASVAIFNIACGGFVL